MAETKDIATEIYVKIRTILEAYQPWASVVEAGNRVWYNDDIGPNSADKPERLEGDFPMSRLSILGGVNNFFTTDMTFETHSSTGPNHWIENSKWRFKLDQKSKLMSVREIDRLGALAADAFRHAGPKLSLSYVIGFKIAWTTRETDIDPDTDMRRYATETNIEVETEIDGATLLGD